VFDVLGVQDLGANVQRLGPFDIEITLPSPGREHRQHRRGISPLRAAARSRIVGDRDDRPGVLHSHLVQLRLFGEIPLDIRYRRVEGIRPRPVRQHQDRRVVVAELQVELLQKHRNVVVPPEDDDVVVGRRHAYLLVAERKQMAHQRRADDTRQHGDKQHPRDHQRRPDDPSPGRLRGDVPEADRRDRHDRPPQRIDRRIDPRVGLELGEKQHRGAQYDTRSDESEGDREQKRIVAKRIEHTLDRTHHLGRPEQSQQPQNPQ
jgi:hypothetical protein